MPVSLTPTNVATQGPQPPLPNLTQPVDLRGIPVFSQVHGKYAQQALAGNLYHSCSAVGGVGILAPSSVNPVCVLWNQAGSGLNIVLAQIQISYVSGTTAPGGIHLATQRNVGNAIGTPISVFTHVDPLNAILGLPYTLAKIRWAPVTTTFAAALTQGPLVGPTYGAITASVTNGPQPGAVDLDGQFIIPPDCAVGLVAVVLTTALFNVRVTWYPVQASSPNG